MFGGSENDASKLEKLLFFNRVSRGKRISTPETKCSFNLDQRKN